MSSGRSSQSENGTRGSCTPSAVAPPPLLGRAVPSEAGPLEPVRLLFPLLHPTASFPSQSAAGAFLVRGRQTYAKEVRCNADTRAYSEQGSTPNVRRRGGIRVVKTTQVAMFVQALFALRGGTPEEKIVH